MKHTGINNNEDLVISYLTLRRFIGIMGIALPFLMIIGTVMSGSCEEVQRSISVYYHTEMRNVLVGVMCAVAFFLLAYKGHDNDKYISRLAALFALGIAFFPTHPDDPLTSCQIEPYAYKEIFGTIHLVCALAFFLILVYFSLFLFTKTNELIIPDQKRKRNIVFRICGYTILLCILCMVVYIAFFRQSYPQIESYHPVFWLEAMALIAFGISWLTKGQILYRDPIDE